MKTTNYDTYSTIGKVEVRTVLITDKEAWDGTAYYDPSTGVIKRHGTIGDDGLSVTPPPDTDIINNVDETPLILVDFDGVINSFPDDKLLRRGGQTGKWLASLDESDPRKRLYSLDNAFRFECKDKVSVYGRDWDGQVQRINVRIRWSRSFLTALDSLNASGLAEVIWLSTWQPWTNVLADKLKLEKPWKTAYWYDREVNDGRRYTGKFNTVVSVLSDLKNTGTYRRVVWVDDEEASVDSEKALVSLGLSDAVPLLMVQPDDRIGVSKKQWSDILSFTGKGAIDGEDASIPGIYSNRTPRAHTGHIGE